MAWLVPNSQTHLTHIEISAYIEKVEWNIQWRIKYVQSGSNAGGSNERLPAEKLRKNRGRNGENTQVLWLGFQGNRLWNRFRTPWSVLQQERSLEWKLEKTGTDIDKGPSKQRKDHDQELLQIPRNQAYPTDDL